MQGKKKQINPKINQIIVLTFLFSLELLIIDTYKTTPVYSTLILTENGQFVMPH